MGDTVGRPRLEPLVLLSLSGTGVPRDTHRARVGRPVTGGVWASSKMGRHPESKEWECWFRTFYFATERESSEGSVRKESNGRSQYFTVLDRGGGWIPEDPSTPNPIPLRRCRLTVFRQLSQTTY